MDARLTRQDLTDLIEAVEAWERKGGLERMMSLLVGGLMVRDRAERERMVRESEAEEKAGLADSRRLKDRAILLRAKLILIRDGLEAQQFLDEPAKER